MAVTLRSISEIELQLAHSTQALSTLEQSMPLFRATGDLLGEGLVAQKLAELYETTGRIEEARQLRAISEPYLRQVGSTEGFH